MADIDDDTVDTAVTELAAERGIGITELSVAVLELTGGERDSVSRGQAVIELANMPEDELVGLAAKGQEAKPADDDEDEDDDMADQDIEDMAEHMAEHQGNEGPASRRASQAQAQEAAGAGEAARAIPFGGEGGAPAGGAGPASAARTAVRAAAWPRALPGAHWSGPGTAYETVALSEDEEWATDEVAGSPRSTPAWA